MNKITQIYLLLLIAVLTFNSNVQANEISKSSAVKVAIKTTFGDIVAEVYTDKAPISANHFLELVDRGIYDNTTFYRTVRPNNGPIIEFKKGEPIALCLIQGGVGDRVRMTIPTIPHENTQYTDLSHSDGALSWGRGKPGTANFSISIGNNSGLDFGNKYGFPADGEGYAVFGQVLMGMDVVRKINQQPTDGDWSALENFPKIIPLEEYKNFSKEELTVIGKFEEIRHPVKIIRADRIFPANTM